MSHGTSRCFYFITLQPRQKPKATSDWWTPPALSLVKVFHVQKGVEGFLVMMTVAEHT